MTQPPDRIDRDPTRRPRHALPDTAEQPVVAPARTGDQRRAARKASAAQQALRGDRRGRWAWRDVALAGLGVIVLLGAGGLYLADRDDRACERVQAEALASVQRQAAARGAIVEQERIADRALQRDLLAVDDDDAEGKAAARQRWVQASDKLAAQRQERPYPEVPTC